AVVVAVRLALQPLAVVLVHLRTVGNGDLAAGEPRDRAELVDEQLGQSPPLAMLVRGGGDAQGEPAGLGGRPEADAGRCLAEQVRFVGTTASEHLLCRV